MSHESRAKLRHYIPLVALSLATCLVLVVVAEVGIRLSRGQLLNTKHLILDKGEHWRSSFYEHDLELGWTPRTGAKLTGADLPWKRNKTRQAGTRAEATVTILEDGIRSNGPDSRTDSQPLVLAVGDSFTFGAQVSDHQSWPAALERLLDVRVLNAGVPAYGLDQAILRAERLAKKYEPTLLVISFIGGDVRRSVRSSRGRAPKPFFRAEAEQLTLHNTPVPLPHEGVDLFRLTFGYSYLVDSIMTVLDPRYWEEGTSHGTGEDAVAIGCLLMKRAAELGGRQNMPVLVMAQSSRRSESPELVAPVLSCADAQGLATLNFIPILAAVEAEDRKRHRSYYIGHMSPAGNEFTARVLAERISATTPVRDAR